MSLSSKPIGSISALSLSSKPIGSISAPPLVSVPNTYSTWHIVGAQNTMLLKNQSVQSLSHVWLFATPWTAAHPASLSITNSWSLLKLIHWDGDAIQTSHPLSAPSPPPSIFPNIRIFPMSQLFAWGGQSIGVSASASVLPMNSQDWFPLGWTDWISLQSKRSLYRQPCK